MAETTNIFDPSIVLSKHDALLDAFVTKLTATLREPDIKPPNLATFAIQLANDSTSTATSDLTKRDLLSRAFQKTLLLQLNQSHSSPKQTSAGQNPSNHDNIRARRLELFDSALPLIDASIHLLSLSQHQTIVDPRLPPQLLESLFSLHSQQELEAKVYPIRCRYEAIRLAASGRNDRIWELYMMKSINACISRDKSGCHPLLSGHLRLTLAASLPPWHQSCLRRAMVYNEELDSVDIDALLKEHHHSSVDTALYRAFWTAQNGMRNPSKAEDPSEWKRIIPCVERVLSAFRTIKPTTNSQDEVVKQVDESNTGVEKLNQSSTMDVETVTQSKSRIPKSLTSPSILRLQVEDIRVRRQVLMQYAIFLHHLEVVAGYRATERDSASTAANIEHCKSLFLPGAEGTRLKKQVYDVMNSDTDGKFKRFVNSILQRERCWIHWKKSTGYNHLTVKKNNPPGIFKRRKVRSKIREHSSINGPLGGSAWKSRQNAWMIPPPEERAAPLIERSKAEFWSRDKLKAELREDMEDEDVTEDTKRKNDSKYVWRTLRMLCEVDTECLSRIATGKKGSIDLEALLSDSQLI